MPLLAENKKAKFDYDILETCEAGLKLRGYEVKAAKLGQIQLKGAYVTFQRGEANLTNAHIARYKPAGARLEYEPDRSRRLLMRKKEIRHLQGKSMEKGLTIIPLSAYTKGRLIKIEVGVGRGRKKYDKREIIKKREIDRELARIRKIGV